MSLHERGWLPYLRASLGQKHQAKSKSSSFCLAHNSILASTLFVDSDSFVAVIPVPGISCIVEE